jgi:hypothetical protein
MRRTLAFVAAALMSVAVAAAAPASGVTDPGRWRLVATHDIPLTYYQGSTGDGQGHFFFQGHVGLYRTDRNLTQQNGNNDVIPPRVHLTEGYDHIGDIDWDYREGGRVLLPLECYYERGSERVCRTGSIGVADPTTLKWRYYVKLDPTEIPKAMWCEVSPDGKLLWTSVGDDLIAYRMSDITRAHAEPDAAPIRSVRRLVGAVPDAGITGAVFFQGRLYLAGQDGRTFTVSSLDLATGDERLEIAREIVGEAEGLAVVSAFGGTLQWQVMPYNTETIPTYGIHHGELLSFAPVG